MVIMMVTTIKIYDTVMEIYSNFDNGDDNINDNEEHYAV